MIKTVVVVSGVILAGLMHGLVWATAWVCSGATALAGCSDRNLVTNSLPGLLLSAFLFAAAVAFADFRRSTLWLVVFFALAASAHMMLLDELRPGDAFLAGATVLGALVGRLTGRALLQARAGTGPKSR